MSVDQVTLKQASDYETIAMSWHESGHTICALFNFMRVLRVHIMSDKNQNGNTSYEMYDSDNIESKILAKVLIVYEVQTLYAGLIAEKMYYKEICGSDQFPMHLRIGSSNDIRDAAILINKYNLSPPGKLRFLFKKQVQDDTQRILSNYWDDIRLVSHLLYKNKDLTFDEIKYSLTRKSENKEFWRTRFKEIKILYNDNKELNEKYVKDMLLQNAVIIM